MSRYAAKVHYIGAVTRSGAQYTRCGVEAYLDGATYLTEAGGVLRAIYHAWEGVTCARCLALRLVEDSRPCPGLGRIAKRRDESC